MSASLRITAPREGDVLTRQDGVESERNLTITVSGTAPEGAAVRVNGRRAWGEGAVFTCDIPLDRKRNVIVAEAGDERDALTVWWNKGSRKRYRFSVDDNIQFLKDLAAQPSDYRSLFDHWYLAFWREMHQEFGAKIHLNIYYQTDGFDLVQMPDTWRDEWRENAHWLHLSFHALQDKPDRPYRHARYAQIAHDLDLVCGHIRRFAGDEVLSNTTTVHWAECPKEAIRALRDRGIRQLIALFNVQGYEGSCTTGYYHDRTRCAYCDTRGAWYDAETDLMFIRCTSVINAVALDAIPTTLAARTATPRTAEMVELLIHEQYFRKELDLYQPDVLEKVRAALRWVTERSYAPVFWGDGFLGTPDVPSD
ncbi:MAG TPA: hypothetical protein PLO37_05120 [Candidatus Hydrogenedentes bacterium]|nr:hypothetical protein [Candidatus Hydrogenedentota bacterium]HPG66206.1 hypothetical protein [Candidatus Hydrogenedentota bacterium]